MSTKKATDWLESQNSFKLKTQRPSNSKRTDKRAVTISVTSGKGGVGKTSAAIKSARILSDWGFKVLLVDCDYNLSNTSVKLGVPLNNNFQDYLNSIKNFDQCLYKHGQFHLFSGCNGNFDLFENKLELEKIIIDILVNQEAVYDFIILDSPAGLLKETLVLNAYCDHRFVVVTPDKSSITDSYSLMKILSGKFGVDRKSVV